MRTTITLMCLFMFSGVAHAALEDELHCVIDTTHMCVADRCDSGAKADQITINAARKSIRECFTDAKGLLCTDKKIGFQVVNGALNDWLIVWINAVGPMETFAVNLGNGAFTSTVGSHSGRIQVFQSGLCDVRKG